MSVRAYIKRERSIWVDEKNRTYYNNNNGEGLMKYTHTDNEFAFNIWHQDDFLQTLLDFGAEDYTNHDFVGTIEMGKEDFESMLENCKKEWSADDWKSIKVIQNYFKEGWNWVEFDCY